ncbi:MAG: hypothetical protein HY399_07375 [Elusimicrobia bacterium]|nr:hypothetical protein [Elusimicrobiota bacterium]
MISSILLVFFALGSLPTIAGEFDEPFYSGQEEAPPALFNIYEYDWGLCLGSEAKEPFHVSFRDALGPEERVARSTVRCWAVEGGTRVLASSDLWMGVQKVYTTPEEKFTQSCGVGAGELIQPFSFSPDGKFFAFTLTPFCRESPWAAPVFYFYRVKNKSVNPINLSNLVEYVFDRYPPAREAGCALEISPVDWKRKNQLIVKVGFESCKLPKGTSLPKSQWTITILGEPGFVKEEKRKILPSLLK